MKEIEILCPAKINLLLAVTGKRADGYHDLISLVTPLAFGDRLRITRKSGLGGIRLHVSGLYAPEDPSNLAWQAAEQFLARFGIGEGISIDLDKRIPIAAGLGGGSSDAAGVLRGLSRLFAVDDPEALSILAAEIGSDCPLFLNGQPLIMRGRGERLQPLDGRRLEELAGLSVALFKPAFGISTVWAYKSLASEPSRYADSDSVESMLSGWERGELSSTDLMQNSFEPVAGRKYPSIPLLLNTIRRETGAACLMSGSGSACFAFAPAASFGLIREIVVENWGKSAFFQETTISDIGLTDI